MATQTSVLKYDSGVLDYTPILLTATTTTTTSPPASDASTIESKSIIEKPMKSVLDKKMKKKKKKKKKRGTRTTGVGASTSTLSSANSFDSDANEEEENDEDDIINNNNNNNNNPMLGKLWVQTPAKTTSSSSSSLIFKLYPSSKDTRVGEAIYIEVSEPPPTKNTKGGRKRRRRELHVQYITNYESMMDNDSKSRPQSSSSSSSSSSSIPSSIASKFMQIEGIYGVYHLPHSGPHIVLITESERVYKSPSIIVLPSSSDDVPLMELRKITCLEIVSLRDGTTNRRIVMDNDNGGDEGLSTTTTPSKTTMMMEEEEARQLRLLRKSFAEHELYFTVPCHYYRHHYNIRRRHERTLKNVGHSTYNCELDKSCNDDYDTLDDDDFITVPDVTHTLQRSFMGINNGRQHSSATTSRWWTQYFTATEDATDTATATNKKKKEEEYEVENENSDVSVWGIQQQSNRRAGPQMAPQTGIDPRFFWNELPALSLMPPLSSRHSLTTSDDSREKSSSSSTTPTTSSPYCHLLDHLIPVTSAFVGVRQNIPIPLASSTVASSSSKSISSNNNDTAEAKQQQQQQDMYDQLLISRRSKYRAGTRFTRRGTDETGNVANYAETEQICFIVSRTNRDLPIVKENGSSNGDNNKEIIRLDTSPTTTDQNTPSTITTTLREIYSHVQTRGSIPLHWSSPVMTVGTYRPRVYICVDPLMQARGLRDHLLGDLQRYSLSSSSLWASSPSSFPGVGGDGALGSKTKITMVNLIDKHGDQGRLGRAFDSVLSAVLDVYKNDDEVDDGGSYRSSVNDVENDDDDDDDDDDGCGSDDVAEDDELKKKHPQHSTLPLRIGLTPNSIKHIWYDFHAECKGGRYDRLSQLLEQVIPTLNDQGYFCAALSSPKPIANTTTITTSSTWEIWSLQDGVVRTNCMDCLDRTNVVQSMFGRYMLYRQLHQRIGLSASNNRRSHRRTLPLECVVGYKQRPLTLPWAEGEAAHRYLWADNADAISRLYAGTPALKGDFTRTGKRTRRGAFDDGLNSLQRYYLNNFIDADRQEGMDLLVGSVDFDVTMPTLSSTMSDNDDEYSDGAGRVSDESSRLLMLQELEKRSSKRRGYDGTHARIKVKTGETFGGGDGTNSSTGGAATTQTQSLKWMPKDLHYYMKHEAQLSRSPLSIASREENLDAPTSSDFLLQVTSFAAGDEVPLSESSGDVMNTERSLLITGERPWWAIISSFTRDGDAITKCNRALANVANGKSMQNLGKKVISLAPQPVVIVLSLLLLCRAVPILFAALILAIVSTIGSTQSSSTLVQHEDHAGD